MAPLLALAAAITIDKMAFGPPPAALHVGDKVEWVNRDIFQHSATARDGAFDVVLKPGAKGQVTLTRPGTIEVYCRYHPGMKTVLKVIR